MTGHHFAADWWSFGILLFEMLVGAPPFLNNSPKQVFQEIQQFEECYPKIRFSKFVDKDGVDLIMKLLHPNPLLRFGCTRDGVRAIKNHSFFRDVDWNRILKKEVKAPYIPKLKHTYDTSNFLKFDAAAPLASEATEEMGTVWESKDF